MQEGSRWVSSWHGQGYGSEKANILDSRPQTGVELVPGSERVELRAKKDVSTDEGGEKHVTECDRFPTT